MPFFGNEDFFRPPAGMLNSVSTVPTVNRAGNSTGGQEAVRCDHDDEGNYGWLPTDRAWRSWTAASTACTVVTSALADAEHAWRLWTDNSTSATTDIAWYRWVNDAQQARAVITNLERTYRNMERQRAPVESPEQRRAREEAEVRRMAAVKAEDERRQKATKRAKKLLQDCLTKDQRESYEKHGFFDVVVAGKTYRIHQGTHGNVRLLGADQQGKVKEVRSFCIQPGGVPDEDAMLAQKLLLEADEAEFLRIANARIIN